MKNNHKQVFLAFLCVLLILIAFILLASIKLSASTKSLSSNVSGTPSRMEEIIISNAVIQSEKIKANEVVTVAIEEPATVIENPNQKYVPATKPDRDPEIAKGLVDYCYTKGRYVEATNSDDETVIVENIDWRICMRNLGFDISRPELLP